VTYNLKDFPRTSLAPYNIEAQHPDEFLMHLYGIDPITMAQLVVDQAADLKKRLMTPRNLLDRMDGVGLKDFAQAVRAQLNTDP
jgi:hypothetical protein